MGTQGWTKAQSSKGGKASLKTMTAEERRARASAAASARWAAKRAAQAQALADVQDAAPPPAPAPQAVAPAPAPRRYTPPADVPMPAWMRRGFALGQWR